ncbi:transcription initiation factor IIA subunit 1 [Hetaerina americana]|uniref:transcription initiation factor IIA subunit 1 n=1 Tax=Hetaerina americana TaxID=62018 RepID=UPI003A7F340E
MALSQTTVLKVYRSVMEDVIAGVRELFLDDGVDEQVLIELRHIWENKLLSSKAIDLNPEAPEPQPPVVTPGTTVAHHHHHPTPPPPLVNTATTTVTTTATGAHSTAVTPGSQSGNNHFQGNSNPPQQGTSNPAAAANPAPTAAIIADANKTVPVQITLPPQAGSNDSHPRVLTIQVPASALQGNQLHSVLSGPVISATMALPLHLATSLLQQHVTTALQGQMQVAAANSVLPAGNNNAVISANNVASLQQQHGKVAVVGGGVMAVGGTKGVVRQLDGAGDTSDEEDDEDEEEDGEDDGEDKDERDEEDEEEDGEDNEGGAEEEPLNSEDDVSDEDPTDLFDTDNVVVCQYDKITRSRNKWKFYLKDGIMNLGGKDFVFQRANGDAEW